MFGSKKSETPAPPSPTPEKASVAPETAAARRKVSEITAGLTVVGRIEGDGDVRLDGRLEGDVRCRALTIGSTGELIGRIEAEELTVQGRIEGDVRAKRVRLEATAKVIGDVAHDVLEVAAGATIEGRYSRGAAKADKLSKSAPVDVSKDPPPRAPARPLAKPANGGGLARPALAASATEPRGASDA
ncbi:MAG: polymer-forming cytoskeletal protein [Marivibrio sp.]|uniref:bactofilin family protein n=1 Tax=Marivibrio sp. TaxID=2039719 RepID=UPI0032EDBEBA